MSRQVGLRNLRVVSLCSAALLGACGAPDDAPTGPTGGAASGGSSAAFSGSAGQQGQPVAGNGSVGGSGANMAGLGGTSSAGNSQGGTPNGGSSSGGATAGAGGASAGTGGAGTAGAGTGGTGTAGAGGMGTSPLPPITDYKATGPYTVTIDKNVGPSTAYTVYRPSTLGQNGFLHAPIIFGPGIGQQVSVHNTMLSNFASHGFVVVGTPVLNQGPGGAENLASMQKGLDWILEQNTAAGIYQGKLDVNRAVSMGYSVGGTSAVQLGGHKAVATVVSIHGHTASAELHGPMLQTTGTKDTVGLPLQQATYTSSKVQTFLATVTGADHGYIQNNGGGEERPAILAWMRLFIYNDLGAKGYFYGADCTICKAPWENPQRKNWPQ
jgi:hypothetical protein